MKLLVEERRCFLNSDDVHEAMIYDATYYDLSSEIQHIGDLDVHSCWGK